MLAILLPIWFLLPVPKNGYLHKLLSKNIFSVFGGVGFTVVLLFCMVPVELLRSKLKKRHRELTEPLGYQIYLETLRPKQLTQASLLQKNQMFQNVFLIFSMLKIRLHFSEQKSFNFEVTKKCILQIMWS